MRNARCLFILFFLSGILTFPSCTGDPKHPSELASADSLNRTMKIADSLFRSMDSVKIKQSLFQINYSLAFIQLNQKDTINREEGQLLLNFYNLKRPLTAFSKQKKEIEQKIRQEKEQCADLAHDLKHNTLDPKLNLAACLKNERKRVEAITSFCTIVAPAVAESMKHFKELYPRIEARVNQLKAKGGKEPQGIDKLNDIKEDRD